MKDLQIAANEIELMFVNFFSVAGLDMECVTCCYPLQVPDLKVALTGPDASHLANEGELLDALAHFAREIRATGRPDLLTCALTAAY